MFQFQHDVEELPDGNLRVVTHAYCSPVLRGVQFHTKADRLDINTRERAVARAQECNEQDAKRAAFGAGAALVAEYVRKLNDKDRAVAIEVVRRFARGIGIDFDAIQKAQGNGKDTRNRRG